MSDLLLLLRRELELVDGFVSLLREEQDALTAGDGDVLAEVVARKGKAAEQLALADRQRAGWSQRHGLPPELPALAQWLERQGPSPLLDAWRALMQSARAAKTLNASNGLLITQRLNNTQESLNSLLGQQRQATSLYGRNGQTSTLTGSRLIDSA
ncbi:MAG: hypothetical protein RIR00_1186 [Pseudomonadota bacterium]|jgi:flagella synthesis protein FlgN